MSPVGVEAGEAEGDAAVERRLRLEVLAVPHFAVGSRLVTQRNGGLGDAVRPFDRRVRPAEVAEHLEDEHAADIDGLIEPEVQLVRSDRVP